MAERVAPPQPATADRWTYDRYLRETAEGEYFTIIEGEKIVSPSPTYAHQIILLNLAAQIQTWVRRTEAGKLGLAPLDVILAEDEIVQPDLFFVLTEHLERLTDKNLQGAPDLVVEILSPGSIHLDRVKKRALYARHRVPEYWIVSPGERTVEVLRLQGEGYELAQVYEEGEALQSPLLPGFACAAKDLFAE